MSKFSTPTKAEQNDRLDIQPLEQRLEMVHLSAVEAESAWKCDIKIGAAEA